MLDGTGALAAPCHFFRPLASPRSLEGRDYNAQNWDLATTTCEGPSEAFSVAPAQARTPRAALGDHSRGYIVSRPWTIPRSSEHLCNTAIDQQECVCLCH